MKRINKSSKRGFTLLEMMLALAIILLISGLFVSLIVAVKDSFYRVYNDNDSTDYAALYAQALENQMLYDYQNNKSNTYYVYSDGDAADYVLVTTGNVDTFGFRQMNNFNKNKDGIYKWRIYLTASVVSAPAATTTTPTAGATTTPAAATSAAGTVNYTFYLVDNYYNPGELIHVYSGSFWIPSHGSFQQGSGPSIKVDTYGSEVTLHPSGQAEYSIQPNQIIITAGAAGTPTTTTATS